MHTPTRPAGPEAQPDLRRGAITRLWGAADPNAVETSPAAALAVLHQLASSPATAVDALAMLHELQVHQVELDIQNEEMRSAQAELEAELARQIRLYEHAPVGYFTVGIGTRLCELNQSGARMLGLAREDLLDHALDSFLSPRSVGALHTLLARVLEGHAEEGCELQLIASGKAPRSVLASASADPDGARFLVVFSALADESIASSR